MVLHAKRDFHTHKCNFDTYACEYDTYECDYDTFECDLYTQSAILYAECDFYTHNVNSKHSVTLTRMNMFTTLTTVISTRIRMISTRKV
jgi:hypothetical protein